MLFLAFYSVLKRMEPIYLTSQSSLRLNRFLWMPRTQGFLRQMNAVGTQGGISLYKDRKTHKSRSEEKVVFFISASLFPPRKQEADKQGGTRGINHPTQKRTQGVSTVKGWEK